MTEAELESIAQQLVARLRDDDPEAVNRWLCSQLSNPNDWFRLCFVLAAAVPIDESWRSLTAWTELDPWVRIDSRTRLAPCGTRAAAERHRYNKEPLCGACRDAVREYDRERKRKVAA